MISYADKELFEKDSIHKEVLITYDNVTLTNSDIISESLELTEILGSSDEIRVGECCASQIKFRIGYTAQSLIGKTITVSIQPQGGDPLTIGTYIIDSDQRTADRRYKDIVAYDVLKGILEADVADWYNNVFGQQESITLKAFRDSFFSHFNVTQKTQALTNDDMPVRRTIYPTTLSGKDVIQAICEANGVFGHINRETKFVYIELRKFADTPPLFPSETLYPSETLFPADGFFVIGRNKNYINIEYEDYETALIDKLQIRQEEDDIGKIIGSGNNAYIIEGNFLFFGMTSNELSIFGQKIFEKLQKIQYIPAHIELRGNPCYEVGDGVEVLSTYKIVYTYIMSRTLKGIQALYDTYDATGSEYRTNNVNGIHSQIEQLKGRANLLSRTIEETRSELIDLDAGTRSMIRQTADEIEATVSESTSKYKIPSGLTIHLYGYGNPTKNPAENINKYYLDNSTGQVWYCDGHTWTTYGDPLPLITDDLSARITINANSIASEVTAREEADGETLSEATSRIEQSATKIMLSVKSTGIVWDVGNTIINEVFYDPDPTQPPDDSSGQGATNYYWLNQQTGTIWYKTYGGWHSQQCTALYVDPSSAIVQTASEIALKVSASDLCSTLSVRPEAITLSSNRLIVNSDYFHLMSDGTGNLGGLVFDADGFYSAVNGDKVFRVYPNPSSGFAVSVGSDTVRRIFWDGSQWYYTTDQLPFSIGHDGEVYVTHLQVKNEYPSDSGTPSDLGQLHVDDFISCWGNIEIGNVDGSQFEGGSLYVYHNSADLYGDTGNVIAQNYIFCNGQNGGTGDVEASHDLIYGNACYQSSDERLKKDVKDLENSEEFIYNLRPVSYRMIDDDKKTHRGFIAQEVEKLVEDDSAIVGENPRTKYKTLAYTEIIADLVKTVQAQNERIKKLEERLNAESVSEN